MKQRSLPGFRAAKREQLHVQALRDDDAIVVVIPGIKLVPGDNAREHWAVKVKFTPQWMRFANLAKDEDE